MSVDSIQIMSGTPAIAAGQFVCDGPAAGGPFVQLATATALSSVASITGVANTSGSPPASINVAVSGLVQLGTTGLSSGIACAVTVDTSGHLRRVTDPSVIGFRYIVGFCDTLGNMTVSPQVSDGKYDPCWFGAKGDGSTSDVAAINAAIAAFGMGSGVVKFPSRTFRVDSNLTFPANVSVEFVKGGELAIEVDATATFNGPIIADPDRRVFKLRHLRRLHLSGIASLTGLQDIHPEWFGALGDGATDDSLAFADMFAAMGSNFPGHAKRVVLSKVYFLASKLQVPTICTIEGRHGGSTYGPTLKFGATVGSDGFGPCLQILNSIDGATPTSPSTILRDFEILGPGRQSIPAYQANHPYKVDDIVASPDGFDDYEGRWLLECTREGTTPKTNTYSFTKPLNPRIPNNRVDDGGVTWRCIAYPGLLIQGRVFAHNISIEGFTTAGVHMQTGLPPGAPVRTNANNCHLQEIVIAACGMGYVDMGDDSNAGCIVSMDIENVGANLPGKAGIGLYSHSFLGMTYVAVAVEVAMGRPFVSDNGTANDVFIQPVAEGGAGGLCYFSASTTVIGGTYGTPIDPNQLGAIVHPAGALGRNLKVNADTGVFGPGGLGPGSSTVSLIDTASNTVVATVTVPLQPHGVAVTPDGRHAYVTDVRDGRVSVIDTATNTLVILTDGTSSILVGTSPFAVAVTPDGKHAYVANQGSNNVSVIDTATNRVVATVPVGREPIGVAVTPEGKHAYVANQFSNTVSVIDTATNSVMATVPVGREPIGVAVTPDGKHAYVANTGFAGTVSVIDTARNTVVATVQVGPGLFGVAITPDGKHAYVTNGSSNTVSVIDTATNTVVATVQLPVGSSPVGVAITGKHAYVANSRSNNVSVIDTASNTVVGIPIQVGTSPKA